MRVLSEGLILLMLLCFISCGETADSDNVEKQETPEETAPVSIESLKNPCELLSRSEIESIDGFEKSSECNLHKASGDTYKQANFLVDDRKLGIVFRRLSEKEIERKKLESDYDFYLKQDTYSEVPNAPGDQAIFSYSETTVPSGTNYTYSLKWRYGNHTEREIGITYSNDEQDPEEMMKPLVAMAKIMEN